MSARWVSAKPKISSNLTILYVATSRLWRFSFFSECMLWLGLGAKKQNKKKTLRWGLENMMFRLKIPVSVATNRPEKCPEVSLKNTQSCNHKHSCRRHSFMLNINGFFCHHRRRWKMSWGRPKIFGDVTLANAETAWLLVKTLVSHLQIP